MASDQEATNKIYYSWDEGLSWEEFLFSEDKIEVTNIIIEPSNTSQKFIIYGETTLKSGQKKQGVLISIDFSSVHQRECQGADDPTDPDSDYELWTPNGRISPDCLLGRSITYTRRKREAKCFNPEQWERVKYVKNCECTEEDWECDEGFVRHGDGECIAENG